MKLRDEREDEADLLRELKERVPPYSKFGDDHLAAIDAQIWVLERNPTEREMLDEAREERWPDNVIDAAVEALRWLDWQNHPAPSRDWETLL